MDKVIRKFIEIEKKFFNFTPEQYERWYNEFEKSKEYEEMCTSCNGKGGNGYDGERAGLCPYCGK